METEELAVVGAIHVAGAARRCEIDWVHAIHREAAIRVGPAPAVGGDEAGVPAALLEEARPAGVLGDEKRIAGAVLDPHDRRILHLLQGADDFVAGCARRSSGKRWTD